MRNAGDERAGRRDGMDRRIRKVRASRESAALLIARQDDAAYVVILLELGQLGLEALVEVLIPGVAGTGAAQRQNRDVTANLAQ